MFKKEFYSIRIKQSHLPRVANAVLNWQLSLSRYLIFLEKKERNSFSSRLLKELAECHSKLLVKLEKMAIRRKAVQGKRKWLYKTETGYITDLSLVWEATAKIFHGSLLRPILFNQRKKNQNCLMKYADDNVGRYFSIQRITISSKK